MGNCFTARLAAPNDGAPLSAFDGGKPLLQFAQTILCAKFRPPEVVELGSTPDLANKVRISAWEEGLGRVEFGAELDDNFVVGIGVAR